MTLMRGRCWPRILFTSTLIRRDTLVTCRACCRFQPAMFRLSLEEESRHTHRRDGYVFPISTRYIYLFIVHRRAKYRFMRLQRWELRPRRGNYSILPPIHAPAKLHRSPYWIATIGAWYNTMRQKEEHLIIHCSLFRIAYIIAIHECFSTIIHSHEFLRKNIWSANSKLISPSQEFIKRVPTRQHFCNMPKQGIKLPLADDIRHASPITLPAHETMPLMLILSKVVQWRQPFSRKHKTSHHYSLHRSRSLPRHMMRSGFIVNFTWDGS